MEDETLTKERRQLATDLVLALNAWSEDVLAALIEKRPYTLDALFLYSSARKPTATIYTALVRMPQHMTREHALAIVTEYPMFAIFDNKSEVSQWVNSTMGKFVIWDMVGLVITWVQKYSLYSVHASMLEKIYDSKMCNVLEKNMPVSPFDFTYFFHFFTSDSRNWQRLFEKFVKCGQCVQFFRKCDNVPRTAMPMIIKGLADHGQYWFTAAEFFKSIDTLHVECVDLTLLKFGLTALTYAANKCSPEASTRLMNLLCDENDYKLNTILNSAPSVSTELLCKFIVHPHRLYTAGSIRDLLMKWAPE